MKWNHGISPSVMVSMLVVAAFAPPVASAEEHGSREPHAASHADAHLHRNHAALFAGATTFNGHGTHFSLGGDYLRYLSPGSPWAIGVFGEAVFAEHTEWAFGMPVHVDVLADLWVRAGPGLELVQVAELEAGHGEGSAEHADVDTKTEAEFLFRIGVGYDFELGGITVSPSMDWDAVRGADALVWGVNVGRGF